MHKDRKSEIKTTRDINRHNKYDRKKTREALNKESNMTKTKTTQTERQT